MNKLKRGWRHVPDKIRKPIVLVIGLLFVLAAAATGWLPGPGGIPLFLIGIAILATEFTWAARVQDGVLKWVERAGLWIRQNSHLGAALIATGMWIAISIAYVLFS